MRVRLVLLFALTSLIVPAGAWAKGLGVDTTFVGPSGIASVDGATRYATPDPNDANSMVVKIDATRGVIDRVRRPGGMLSIPAVALDGSPGGLSADGTTLMLTRALEAYPPTTTHFRVLDARTLKTRNAIDLPGWYSFDAISPDGTRAYLIRYTGAPDPARLDAPTQYEVRAMDTATGTLDPAPIVDAREPDEKMTGMPVTRATSPDGRWAYTLYGRPNEKAFIHALDTADGVAHCIDLPVAVDPYATGLGDPAATLEVSPHGRSLTLLEANRAAATVDLVNFATSDAPSRAVADGASNAPTIAGAVALCLALLAAAGLWRRHIRGASTGRSA